MLAMLAIRIGFIGAGRMATALARGFVRSKTIAAGAIVAADPSEAARAAFLREVSGATIGGDNAAVAAGADVVLLAVKPQQMTAALAEIRDALQPTALVVSIAAGVTLDRLAAGLPADQRIVRVMPNTPCLIGRGASAYSLGPHATGDDGELVAKLLSSVGAAFEVPESLLDAVTGRDVAAARLASAQLQLDKSQVKAPWGGRIAVRRVEVGDYVSLGQPLLELVDVSRLKVRAPARSVPPERPASLSRSLSGPLTGRRG